MTAQEYFDLLCRTSRDGGFPSMSDHANGCAYRGDNGRKCAIGLLIPDNIYDKSIEGTPIDALTDSWHSRIDRPSGISTRQLFQIQSAHDSRAVPGQEWDHAAFVHHLQGIDCFAGFADPTASPAVTQEPNA